MDSWPPSPRLSAPLPGPGANSERKHGSGAQCEGLLLLVLAHAGIDPIEHLLALEAVDGVALVAVNLIELLAQLRLSSVRGGSAQRARHGTATRLRPTDRNCQWAAHGTHAHTLTHSHTHTRTRTRHAQHPDSLRAREQNLISGASGGQEESLVPALQMIRFSRDKPGALRHAQGQGDMPRPSWRASPCA